MTDEQESSTLLRAPARTPGYAPTLMHGDCLDLMARIPDGSVDMICCDLPYGTTACKWDTVIPFDKLWEQYKRLIKPNGAIVLFGSQPFTSALVMSNQKMFKYEWIWEKEKPVNIFFSRTQPLKYHENIIVFSKAGSHNMSGEKMVYNPKMQQRREQNKRNNKPRINKNDGVFGDRVFINVRSTGNDDYIFPPSIQKFNTDRASKLHPTQKPVALCEYLIRTYTNEGETVLDNCMGSGTTGVACLNTGRNFIGMEKDQKYFEIARNRIMGHNV